MSDQVSLKAENREIQGKSSSRLLRRGGSVPAIIYGGSKEPLRISILEKDISKASSVPGFTTQILNISIAGNDENVIIKEIQRHPATERVLHADLMRVDPDTKISISVPIRFINEESCIGVKMHGGAISHLINDVDIYNRYIAICTVNSININQWMVKNGWAIAYRYYSTDYVNDEIFARENKLGIWKSKFIEPYLYRKKNK